MRPKSLPSAASRTTTWASSTETRTRATTRNDILVSPVLSPRASPQSTFYPHPVSLTPRSPAIPFSMSRRTSLAATPCRRCIVQLLTIAMPFSLQPFFLAHVLAPLQEVPPERPFANSAPVARRTDDRQLEIESDQRRKEGEKGKVRFRGGVTAQRRKSRDFVHLVQIFDLPTLYNDPRATKSVSSL